MNKHFNSALAFLAKIKNAKRNIINKETIERYRRYAKIELRNYFNIVLEPDILIEGPIRRDRTLESFSESDCWNFFEYRKCDLPRVLRCLRIPEWIILEKKSGFNLLLC